MIRHLWLCGVLLGAGCRLNEPAQRPGQADAAPAAPMTANKAAAGGQAAPGDAGAAVVAAAPEHPPGESEPARSKPAVQACATDTDCYAISNYCGGCQCEVANAKEERKCKDGERVACFADPCLNKATQCHQGRCQLVDKAPPER